ncbi:hypothetical protein J2S03_002826 [Alicyclobacillus cycloheptanicus]|uniref:Uncharacterized protein n=1 Tax=Alicyclobacillus cycloheptanicus TaxID=1457 RepID=A0ABT9XKX6_9BACL|nr:hypothetical protein [Alicyclobacillus cycloheptanicus]
MKRIALHGYARGAVQVPVCAGAGARAERQHSKP